MLVKPVSLQSGRQTVRSLGHESESIRVGLLELHKVFVSQVLGASNQAIRVACRTRIAPIAKKSERNQSTGNSSNPSPYGATAAPIGRGPWGDRRTKVRMVYLLGK